MCFAKLSYICSKNDQNGRPRVQIIEPYKRSNNLTILAKKHPELDKSTECVGVFIYCALIGQPM